MFIDEVTITLTAGHGGPGKVSYPSNNRSGPDGGNGGRGGDIYLKTTSDLTMLQRYIGKKELGAQNGEAGGSNKKTGKNGDELDITVPMGSTIIDTATKEEINLDEPYMRVLFCKGGLGGRGNFEFRSSRNTTPMYAQPGLPGEEKKIFISLKLIADFGLIGLPNVGKSSLLNEITNTSVKTANYPFTTLEPNLGVFGDLILADIPGLIEGASEGKGLGIKFLKHIEKTKKLLHCISAESQDPIQDYQTIRDELGKYNAKLLKKKELILLTKTDLVDKESVKKIVKLFRENKKKAVPVSIHDLDKLESLEKLLIK